MTVVRRCGRATVRLAESRHDSSTAVRVTGDGRYSVTTLSRVTPLRR